MTRFAAVRESVPDAVDGSSTGTRVPKKWALLRLPRFGGASHANGFDNLVSTSPSRFSKFMVLMPQAKLLSAGSLSVATFWRSLRSCRHA
jgi:hypothetical protein